MNKFEKLSAASASVRLQAALAVGTEADSHAVGVLIQRSGVEEDFFVRDMLTWALTRMPKDQVIPRLIEQLDVEGPPFAVSQSLHTLSKIADPSAPSTWQELVIRPELLHRRDTAQTAWRTFTGLVPDEKVSWLVEHLLHELGKGSYEEQRSLGRALIELTKRGASISKPEALKLMATME